MVGEGDTGETYDDVRGGGAVQLQSPKRISSYYKLAKQICAWDGFIFVRYHREKQKVSELQKQLKVSEKALEDARMRNIALNMLIDVAEEKLHISIRKKPGAKQ